jgi:hypothetical protein
MGELLILALFPISRFYVSDEFYVGHLSCRVSISITKFLKPPPHQEASPSSLAATPKVTESSVFVPSRIEGVHKEGTGDDAGHVEKTGHTSREGAHHAREDAMELAR